MSSLRDHTIRYKNTRCKITEVVNANCSDVVLLAKLLRTKGEDQQVCCLLAT